MLHFWKKHMVVTKDKKMVPGEKKQKQIKNSF